MQWFLVSALINEWKKNLHTHDNYTSSKTELTVLSFPFLKKLSISFFPRLEDHLGLSCVPRPWPLTSLAWTLLVVSRWLSLPWSCMSCHNDSSLFTSFAFKMYVQRMARARFSDGDLQWWIKMYELASAFQYFTQQFPTDVALGFTVLFIFWKLFPQLFQTWVPGTRMAAKQNSTLPQLSPLLPEVIYHNAWVNTVFFKEERGDSWMRAICHVSQSLTKIYDCVSHHYCLQGSGLELPAFL